MVCAIWVSAKNSFVAGQFMAFVLVDLREELAGLKHERNYVWND